VEERGVRSLTNPPWGRVVNWFSKRGGSGDRRLSAGHERVEAVTSGVVVDGVREDT
jgi:hypothetical protein